MVVLVVAEPPTSRTGEPKGAPSIWNCTVPVAAGGDTIAVNVTDWPCVAGFVDDVTDVDVTVRVILAGAIKVDQ